MMKSIIKKKTKIRTKSRGFQTLITKFFKKKIYGYDSLENTWRCGECGIDMGPGNPRQYCGKYYCENIGF